MKKNILDKLNLNKQKLYRNTTNLWYCWKTKNINIFIFILVLALFFFFNFTIWEINWEQLLVLPQCLKDSVFIEYNSDMINILEIPDNKPHHEKITDGGSDSISPEIKSQRMIFIWVCMFSFMLGVVVSAAYKMPFK